MKYFFIIISCLALQSIACKKSSVANCTDVLVTQTGTPCGEWGINVKGTVYPSSNIPDAFKTEGKAACAEYQLYTDMRLCPCCGGTWATIQTIK